MHASSEDEDLVVYDDEPRNPREELKHRESADILHAGALEMKQMRDRFVAEAISDGVVKIRYTPSAYNYSDILTKPLTEVMFQRMIEMCLGSKDSQIAERGHQVEGFLCTGYDSYLVYIY